MRRKTYLVATILLVLASVLACTASTTPTQAPPKTGVTTPPTAVAQKQPWETEWEKTLAAARVEGMVTVYGIRSPESRDAIINAVKNKYGIDVEFSAGRGADVATKLIQERRAGLFLGDVYVGGTTTIMNVFKPAGVLDPLEPAMILPEVKDPTVWWGGKHVWIDKDRTSLAYGIGVGQRIARNTDLTRPEELKSYKDLLNPKWKGKIVFNDPTISGTGERWFRVVGKIMGLDYMRELAKQEPALNRDERLQVDWVARGKYPIGISLKKEITDEFRRAGAPITEFSAEEGAGISSGSDSLAMINRPAHPNATKVYINWILSKDGQTVVSTSSGILSARMDVPRDHVDPVLIPDPKKQYIFSDDEEFLLKAEEDRLKAVEIFGHLLK